MTPKENLKYTGEPLKERLKKNSVSNILFFVITFPLMFILTPLILKYTGKEAYGVWALTGTILVFIELLGGMQTSTALGIMVPKFDPEKDSKDINELTNTLFWFYVSVAIVLSAVFVFLKQPILNMFFKVEKSLADTASFVLVFSFFIFLLNFILLSFANLMSGFNIFYVYNIVHIIFAFLRFGLMAAVLFAGYGIKGIAAAQMGVLIFETLLIIAITKFIYPPLRFGPRYFNPDKLKKLLVLSLKLIMNRMAVLVNYNADKLVLGYFLTPVIAAYYQIGSNIAKYISQVPEMLGLISLMPAASELKVKNQIHKLGMLYTRVNKYIFFLAIFIFSGIIIFGREFISIWLGPGYEDVYLVLIILSAAYTAALAGYVSMNLLNGLERIRETFIISAVSAVLNVVLSIVLTKYYGLKGALTGTAISMAGGGIALAILFYRMTGIKMGLVDVFLKPVITAAVCFAGYYAFSKHVLLPSNWLMFFSKAAVFTLVYMGLLVAVLRHFDAYDWDLLKNYLGKKKEP